MLKNVPRKILFVGLTVVIFGLISIGFSNCGGKLSEEFVETGSDSLSSADVSLNDSGGTPVATGAIDINDPRNLGTDLCEKQIRSAFSAGYHQFFQSRCISCHSSGPGRGRFANGSLEIAFTDFQSMGYITLSDKAKSTHQVPYTGSDNAPVVNGLQSLWGQTLAEYVTCKGGNTAPPQPVRLEDRVALRTAYKAIPVMGNGESRDVTFDLNTELQVVKDGAVKPSIPGAQLVISVTRKLTSGGQSYYLLSKPRLKNSPYDLRIKTLFSYINFQFLSYPTTFLYIDTSVYKLLTTDLAAQFSTGSLVAPGVFSSSDKLALGFETLEVVNLPPPPPPQTVTFVGPAAQVVPLNSSSLEVTVQLARPAEQVINMSVSEVASELCGTPVTVVTANTVSKDLMTNATCYPEVKQLLCASNAASCANKLQVYRARSKVGSTYNRFDWDFTLENTNLVFFPGEREKKVKINFSRDIRKEGTRILTLRISIATPGVTAGTRGEMSFAFDKMINPNPPFGVATFAELMDPSTGILGSRCLACHNSTQRAGGYDMSDYDLMIQRGILIPSSSNSEMFVRMNPATNQIDKQPMPLNGFLETYQVREVEKWILNGALNN